MRRVFVGRGCLSCIERVFFSSPEHRERYLGRRRPGRDRSRARRDAAASSSSGRRPASRRRGRGCPGRPRWTTRATAQPRALHERARQGRPRRPNGARPCRRGSTRARRRARDARVGDERSQRRARARSRSRPDRTQQGLSPRALRLRARRATAASAAALGLGGAERALGLFGAARRSIRPIGSARVAPAPPAAPRRRAVARAASTTRSERDARDEPPADRGAGDGVPSADVGSRSRSRVRPAGDAADETLALAGVDARESPGPDETADVGRFFFFADPARAWSRRS